MKTPDDLICLSPLRWGFVFQRPNHLMMRAAASRRVFFFEEPWFDADDESGRLEIRQEAPNLWICVPHLKPGLPGDAVAAVLPTAVARPPGKPLVLRAGMSTIKRTGDWDVPALLELHSGMGTIVLDFCDTVVRHPVVDIEVDIGAGTVRLLLPDDATADVDHVVSTMGTVRSKVPSRPRPGVPHFVVHGRSSMGTLVVRRRYQLGNLRF